jgi:hypothetical protein
MTDQKELQALQLLLDVSWLRLFIYFSYQKEPRMLDE